MSLLKTLLIKLYHTRAIRYFRSEIKRKFTSLLTPVQNTINDLSNTTDILSAQQKYLLNLIEDINQKQDLHTRVHNEHTLKNDEELQLLRTLYANQGFTSDNILHEETKNQFIPVVRQIINTSYPFIHKHTELIFEEIFIGHMHPGGIWQLKNDIASFTKKPLPPTETNLQPNPSLTTKASLKILIISDTFPSLMHGGGGRLLDIITELSKENKIDLYTHFNPELDGSSLDLLKNNVENIQTVSHEELTVDMVGTWLRSIGRAAKYYDIIQLEYPQTIRFIHPMRQYGHKVGYTFMECLSLSYADKLEEIIKSQNYDSVSKYARKFWQAVADEKYALENADYTIAVTTMDAIFLKRLSPKKPHIIPTCISNIAIIEEAKKVKDTNIEENTVMFLGFFGHWPNIEAVEWYLRDIHPLVQQEIPGYKFYIVGSGDVSDIRRISKGDKSVVITGMVDSVVPYILKAKVCVSPLISGAGIRGKQNQYSILGRPSVTTSTGNNGLEYKHEDSVLIADNAKNFAESIIRLLSDDELYLKLQRNSQNIAAACYTWPSHIKKLTTIYQQHDTYSA